MARRRKDDNLQCLQVFANSGLVSLCGGSCRFSLHVALRIIFEQGLCEMHGALLVKLIQAAFGLFVCKELRRGHVRGELENAAKAVGGY